MEISEHTDRDFADSKNVTIVIPTLNEAEAIGLVIDELKRAGCTNILVVDGHSSDCTVKIVKEANVKVIVQDGKGKMDALKTAIKYCETPYVLVMDGDHTYDPAYIDDLLACTGYDEVIGARLIDRENISTLHRFGNWIVTKIFNLLFSVGLRDVCSGMYLLKREVAEEIGFESKGFSAEVELASHVASTSRRLTEVPVRYRPRIGEAKLKSSAGFQIAWDAVKLAWKYNPVFFILASGASLMLPSLAVLAWVAYRLLFLNAKHFVWAIIGVVGAGIGVTSLLLAVMALHLKRMEYRLLESIRRIHKNRIV